MGTSPLKRGLFAGALCAAALGVAVPAAVGGDGGKSKPPATIALPNGWQPEGIASGRGPSLYVGSIPTGAIWKGNARTGKGAVLVPPHEGRAATGIKVDHRNRVIGAGAGAGSVYVYSAKDGRDLADYRLAPEGANTFVNDVVVTRKAAYLTDSRLPQIYKLPFGRRGKLPSPDKVRTIPLTGDIVYGDGINANGIVALKGGKALIIVQSNTGKLFRVNPKTGVTDEVDLGGATVVNGDGLLRRGRKLYVVRNRDNKVAVVSLGKLGATGVVKKELTNPAFDVPTTLAFSVGRLWAVNARFGTPPTPETTYDIVRVR